MIFDDLIPLDATSSSLRKSANDLFSGDFSDFLSESLGEDLPFLDSELPVNLDPAFIALLDNICDTTLPENTDLRVSQHLPFASLSNPNSDNPMLITTSSASALSTRKRAFSAIQGDSSDEMRNPSDGQEVKLLNSYFPSFIKNPETKKVYNELYKKLEELKALNQELFEEIQSLFQDSHQPLQINRMKFCFSNANDDLIKDTQEENQKTYEEVIKNISAFISQFKIENKPREPRSSSQLRPKP